MLKDLARLSPRRSAERKKRVERIFRKDFLASKFRRLKMAELFEDRKVDNQIADRDSYARLTVSRLKHAERQILNRKMRIGWDFDERFERHLTCSGALRAST